MIAAAWKVIEHGTEIADRDVVEIGPLLGTVHCVLVFELVISLNMTLNGTLLRFFQTISENTSFWQLKRLVTLSTYRRYTNNCIYLSIYLSSFRE